MLDSLILTSFPCMLPTYLTSGLKRLCLSGFEADIAMTQRERSENKGAQNHTGYHINNVAHIASHHNAYYTYDNVKFTNHSNTFRKFFDKKYKRKERKECNICINRFVL